MKNEQEPSNANEERTTDLGIDTTELKTKPKHRLWLWIGLALIAVAGVLAWAKYAVENEAKSNINTYEECVAAGYPVMESYPEQCAVPGGQSFTRQLSEEEQAALNEESEEHEHHYTSVKGVEIVVDEPHEDEDVSSPLEVSGQVPGNWSFEGMFPIKLLDSNGSVVAEATAQLNGDWMTDELVPFSATLTFTKRTGAGNLVLMNDNPSGLVENEDSLSLPISFD